MREYSLAVVRPWRPNLAELAIYRRTLPSLHTTFFYAGLDAGACRAQLDGLGLEQMAAVRYRSCSDWVRSPLLRRALDFKFGIASGMLTHLDDVLRHDIINIVDPIYAHTWQIVRRMRPKQKLMVVRWENLYGRYEQVWRARSQAARVLARANAIVCVTQAALRTLRLPSGFQGTVEQIYPGVDQAGTSATEARPPATILFVGRPQWCKGLHSLLVALHILRHCWNIDAQLQAIGVEPEDCRLQLRQLGLGPYVHCAGRLSNTDVRARMRNATLFCVPSLLSPSWSEQFGFAMAEAMAHGLPVVAFDSGAIREICGECGVYASAGNALALAEALRAVILNPVEAAQRGNALRTRCRRKFNAATQGDRMLSCIEGMLSRSREVPQASSLAGATGFC